MESINIVELFHSKGLKATPQRIAIYDFLRKNPIHPDADTVYQNVVKLYPSFSKTTVYNCLQAFCDNGLIIEVKIDNDKIRYDADTSFHGHFKCNKCGKIYDFRCTEGAIMGIDGFLVSQKDVYYSGLCNCCNN